jgi:ketosteroid isomerase-like protein
VSSADHPLVSETVDSVRDFNAGSVEDAVKAFAPDVEFTVPGRSAVAGTYRGKEGVADFFRQMHEISGGTLNVTPDEVLSSDDHMILFLQFSGERGGEKVAFTIAGFHADRAQEGWRRATFLPDDLAAFDRMFAPT